MNSNETAKADAPRDELGLAGRYGRIGISAVAAAVAYQSDAKNQAYAPIGEPKDNRFHDERFNRAA